MNHLRERPMRNVRLMNFADRQEAVKAWERQQPREGKRDGEMTDHRLP